VQTGVEIRAHVCALNNVSRFFLVNIAQPLAYWRITRLCSSHCPSALFCIEAMRLQLVWLLGVLSVCTALTPTSHAQLESMDQFEMTDTPVNAASTLCGQSALHATIAASDCSDATLSVGKDMRSGVDSSGMGIPEPCNCETLTAELARLKSANTALHTSLRMLRATVDAPRTVATTVHPVSDTAASNACVKPPHFALLTGVDHDQRPTHLPVERDAATAMLTDSQGKSLNLEWVSRDELPPAGIIGDSGHQWGIEERNEIPTAIEFMRDYASLSRPFVVRGAAKHWPAYERWTDEYLRTTVGNAQVRVLCDKQLQGVHNGDGDAQWIPATVAELIDEMAQRRIETERSSSNPAGESTVRGDANGPASDRSKFLDCARLYMGGIGIWRFGEPKALHALCNDLVDSCAQPPFTATLTKMMTNLWLAILHRQTLVQFIDVAMTHVCIVLWIMLCNVSFRFGDGNHTSVTHSDHTENVMAVLSGEKKFTIWSPGQRAYMHLVSKPSYVSMPSYITVPDTMLSGEVPLDTKQFPCAAHARPLHVTLHAGDILFLPAFWFHRVESFGRSLAVNWWLASHSLLMQQVMKSIDLALPAVQYDGSTIPQTRW
jgi:hypothetical protein